MAATDTDRLGAEYRVLTEGCGLVDRSERGKLALSGPGAIEFLNGQVTNELADLEQGEGRYAAFLTHKGKMLGDVRILAPAASGGPAELLLDTERSTLQALFDMIRRFKVGYQVELHKRTLERALLSLIGPLADEVAGTHGLSSAEHANAPATIAGVPALAVRTDVGVDLFTDHERVEALIEALIAHGATQASEQAAECVRIEHGRPRYGLDIDESTIPQEAGLNERAVSFTKGCYVGQETVARLHYKGRPNRHLRGLRLSAPASTGEELRLAERPVGILASATISPRLGPIALALVRREAEPGSGPQRRRAWHHSRGRGPPLRRKLNPPRRRDDARGRILPCQPPTREDQTHVATDLQRVSEVSTEPGELPKTMAAWVIREERLGEPKDAFQIEEIEVPEPGGLRGDRAGDGGGRELQQRVGRSGQAGVGDALWRPSRVRPPHRRLGCLGRRLEGGPGRDALEARR